MHTKPGTIVVGVDGSDSSTRALQWAVAQATAEHRPLTLVHTIHTVTPTFVDAAIASARDARAALYAAGQWVLDDAREKVAWMDPGLEVHDVFDLADPRELLLQLSQTATMVVVGSRGRGQVRSLLLGSVSAALVRHAQCPVVVVRQEDGPGAKSGPESGIVIGADASPESRAVLEFAYRQASLRDLPLTVLDCVWDVYAGTMGAFLVSDAPMDLEGERLALAESMAGMAEKYPDVTVTTTIARGIPQEAIARLAAGKDLVVVGAHQDNRVLQALFGSVSVAVVESATCPVAVVPLFSSSKE